jgi:hypothetical protein
MIPRLQTIRWKPSRRFASLVATVNRAASRNRHALARNAGATFLFVLAVAACGDDPLAPQPGIEWMNISVTDIDVRTSAVDVGSVTISAPATGYVVVRFDGNAVASSGDLLVLAASDMSATIRSNDDNVGFMGGGVYQPHSFSHTRVYDVEPGPNTFYAVARNFVVTDGTGRASVYGTLSVAYYARRY